MTSLLDSVEGDLRKALQTAMSGGAQGSKVTFAHHTGLNSGFEAGRLKTASASEGVNMTVEVLVDGRVGTTSGNRLDQAQTLVADALALAAVGREAHFDAWPAPGNVTPVKTHSSTVTALCRDDLLKPAGQLVERLKQYDPELRVDAGGGHRESESLLLTSGGVCQSTRATAWFLGSHVQRTKGTDIMFAGDGRSWREVNDMLDVEPILDRILQDLRWAEKEVPAPTGKVPVFLPPEALRMFFFPVFMGINGRTVAKGESPLAGRLGEQVLAPCLNVIDDPHQDFSPGATETDQDGIPTRRQALFENGVLQRFLYDLDSAGLAGAQPTGNSGCSPCCPRIEPGTRHSNDLLAGIKDGVLVKLLIGFGQSNIVNGDFSANIGLGYRIQNGEVTGRIKNAMIAGNIYDLLGDTGVELSADTEYTGSWPYAVVPNANISAQAK